MFSENKTWSREVALLMIVYMGYLAFNNSVEALEAIVWPFMAFVVAAFGLKQEAVREFMQGAKK